METNACIVKQRAHKYQSFSFGDFSYLGGVHAVALEQLPLQHALLGQSQRGFGLALLRILAEDEERNGRDWSITDISPFNPTIVSTARPKTGYGYGYCTNFLTYNELLV